MDGDAANVVPPQVYLTGMNPCPYPEPELVQLIAQVTGRPDGTPWTVEYGENPIAGASHHPASVRRCHTVADVVVKVEKGLPLLVTDLLCLTGGVDDVGEEHRCEDAMGGGLGLVTGEELLHRGKGLLGMVEVRKVVTPGDLDQPDPVDVLGEISTVLQGCETAVRPMQDKCRNLHRA